jgi:hypothetical protein
MVVRAHRGAVAARATRQQTSQLTGIVFQPFNEVRLANTTSARQRRTCARRARPASFCVPLFVAIAVLLIIIVLSPSVHTQPPPKQVKAELATVANTNAASESLARCNFKPDLEAAINEQIK